MQRLILNNFKKIKNLFLMSQQIYGREYNKKFIFILIFNIISIILEILSIALILPIIDLILNNGELSFFKSYLNDININAQIILPFIILLFTLKSILIILINRYQLKTTFNLSKNLSKNLFKKYLNKDYIFFTKNNSSDLLRNVFTECNKFALTIIPNVLKLISDFLIIFFLILLLLQINFNVTIIFIIFFSTLGIVYLIFVKDTLLNLGKSRILSEGQQIKFIQEGFRSFQIIKIFKLKRFFLDKYQIQNETSHKAYYYERFYSFLPKALFELFTVIFLIFIIYIFTNFYDDKSAVIIQLSAFGLISVRLMPILNSIIYGLQILRFNSSVIKNLYEIFKEEEINNKTLVASKTIEKNFSLKNIYYKYPSTNKYIIQDLSFSFKKGDMITISGKSGAGKSTLLNIIMGVLIVNKGQILIDDKQINEDEFFNVENLGYVPQNTFLLDDSLENNIILDKVYDHKSFIEAIQLSGLTEFYKETQNKKKFLGDGGIKVSGGQKQRIAIARALYQKSQIIILDEPTSSIDKNTRYKIYNSLKEINFKNNTTIIIVSHDDTNNRITKYNYSLKNGKIEIL